MKVQVKEEVLRKDLKNIDKTTINQLLEKIKYLKNFPEVPNIKKIQGIGENVYRARSGDYRILFVLDEKGLLITVIAVAHRKEIFKYLAKYLNR